MGRKKRKLGGGDSLSDAYQGVTTKARKSTGRPGTPNAFFKDSFDVTVQQQETTSAKKESAGFCNGQVVVHRHANGLCIVAVGETINGYGLQEVKDVKLMVHEAPQGMSANERRKVQSKMLRGGTIADSQGLTLPNTILAQVTLDNGKIFDIPAGVWGAVLELNSNLTSQLLRNDPLLDGYLAIILPTGPFPPRLRHGEAEECDDTETPSKKTSGPQENE